MAQNWAVCLNLLFGLRQRRARSTAVSELRCGWKASVEGTSTPVGLLLLLWTRSGELLAERW